MRRFYILVAFLLAFAKFTSATATERLLEELDSQLSQRPTYDANRLQRIRSLMDLRSTSSSSAEHLYALHERLIEEYVTFQADSAISYFQQNIILAERMDDAEKLASTTISMAHFYASTGFYYEASQLLSSMDTLHLSASLQFDYYVAQHKLNDELQLYSNDGAQRALSLQRAYYYADCIAALSDEGSYVALRIELWQAMQRNDYALSATIAESMMRAVPELSREWATAAFMRGLVAQLMGDNELCIEWMIRSAIVDMRLSIRDYAALKSIATYCSGHDIERSMRYMRVMMEDVQAFNSRLRPWQDAMILPEIEKGYHAYTERVAAEQKRYIYMLGALVVAVILLLVYVVFQNRRLSDARRRMNKANEQLNISVEDLQRATERLTKLNQQIAEANGVKEEYIGIFLQVCSEYIDKMVAERRRIVKLLRSGKVEELRKELDGTHLESAELKQFYNLFDSTFLRLYPSFVEELNALLAEESRFVLKSSEYLNTELRIFALIRLGISDTPRIASLLHYSLSTIYNYRSRIRYNEGITREEFEKRIRTIGSFNK